MSELFETFAWFVASLLTKLDTRLLTFVRRSLGAALASLVVGGTLLGRLVGNGLQFARPRELVTL